MRNFLLLCFFSFFLAGGVLASPPARVIFFGDSLSDNGNLYQLDMHYLPKSPPYYEGRFSNGPTWAETLGQDYQKNSKTDWRIYAWGGATTIKHSAHDHTLPVTLNEEVDRYLFDNIIWDKSKTLFSIWIGGNDYLFDHETDIDTLTTKVVSEISGTINRLIEHHAHQFLILNLPNLGKIPSARARDVTTPGRLNNLTLTHNRKLAIAVGEIRKAHPSVTIVYVDIGLLFDDLLSNPEKYNQMRHVNIQNTTEACWQGGYFGKSFPQKLLPPVLQSASTSPATTGMTETLLTAPDLHEAFNISLLSNAGFVPCANPDQYVFWDGIHPTAVTHRMVAARVEEELEQAGLT